MYKVILRSIMSSVPEAFRHRLILYTLITRTKNLLTIGCIHYAQPSVYDVVAIHRREQSTAILSESPAF